MRKSAYSGIGLLAIFIIGVAVAQPPFEDRAGPPQGKPPAFQRSMPPFGDDMEKQALEFVKQINEKYVQDLEDLKKEVPPIYQDKIRNLFREKQELERIKIQDTDHYTRRIKMIELEFESHSLARKARKNPDDKKKISEDIRKVLEQLFDMREAVKRDQLEMMNKEIQKIQKDLELRKKNRQAIIERYMKELLGEDDLRW